jgi:hypothetical protein
VRVILQLNYFSTARNSWPIADGSDRTPPYTVIPSLPASGRRSKEPLFSASARPPPFSAPKRRFPAISALSPLCQLPPYTRQCGY